MLLPILLANAAFIHAQSANPVGDWRGTLKVGATELRLALHITADSAGSLGGSLDSVDQGANGIPLGAVKFAAGQLDLTVPAVQGGYKAKLDGDTLRGTWTQAGNSFPLDFQRGAIENKRPQEPKRPFPYDETEVSYTSGDVTLAGTLTVPKSRPAPAVLLITGSGQQDRDESIMGHRPFFVLADHLTRNGIAVLRVDDRGVGKSTGDPRQSTTLDFAQDVLAGVEFLKKRPEIDPGRIGLIGHSEGGLIAPIAASQSKDIAFLVLMAGPGVQGDQILYEQSNLIMKASGAPDRAVESNRDVQRSLFAIVRAEPDPVEARKKIRALLDEKLAALPEAQRRQVQAQSMAVASPWFRTFIDLDPAKYLKTIKIPVLAINGELDLQVSAAQNLPAIAKALDAGGNSRHTEIKLPGLNHLFQSAKTGLMDEYGKIEETISPVALDSITSWIVKQTKGR